MKIEVHKRDNVVRITIATASKEKADKLAAVLTQQIKTRQAIFLPLEIRN